MTFVFTDQDFDGQDNLVSWSATAQARLVNSNGICYNALMTLTHRCDVIANIDVNTLDMVDRKQSCSVVNYPVSGNCSGTAIFNCGSGLENNTYRIVYDPVTKTLSSTMTAGQGGEYSGTFTFAHKASATRQVVVSSLAESGIQFH